NDGISLWKDSKKRLVVSFVASIVILGMLALMVHGNVAQFLHVFLKHRNLRATGLSGALPTFWNSITHYYEKILVAPTFALFALATICAGVCQNLAPTMRRWMACSSLALLLGILLFPERARATGEIFALASTLTFLHFVLASRLQWINAVLGVALITQLQLTSILTLCYQRPPTLANIESVRAKLESTKKTMCIDGAVARFVFDYRLPPNAVSFLYGMRSKADAKSFMVCVHDVALKRDDEIW